MGISVSGIGSGLDINGLVNQLVAAEGQPATLRLDRQEATLQAELSAIGTLKGAASSFQASLQSLKNVASFQARSSSVSDSAVLTASTSSTAQAGSYNITVTGLAQAHSLASGVFDATTDTVGTGTLTFAFGEFSGGVFTSNADKATKSVTITSNEKSLAGIRDAVNEANIGVSAAIVYNGSKYQLLFSSTDSGANNSLKITVSEDGGSPTNTDMNDLSQLAYDPEAGAGSGQNLTEKLAALDAGFSINGLAINSSSNTVSNAIDGITLNLLKAGSSTVTVSVDKDVAKNAINSFVATYNNLQSTITDLSGYDADTETAGILLGDATVRGLTAQLRRIISDTVTGHGGTYNSLASIGVTTDYKTGQLTIDDTRLQKALGTNYDDIAGLFAAYGRSTDTFVQYSSATSTTSVGSYAVNVSTLATQGTIAGSDIAGFPLTIDADNDTFVIKVDGVQSETISLTQGSYTTGTQLAAEIQSRINGDTNLQASDVSVTVGYVSGAPDYFTVTSSRYGSASKVDIVSVDTNTASELGLTAGSGTDGVDVAGTIGGISATGSGRFLTGAGATFGMKIEVTGGATGDRGVINFSRGYADLLDSYLGDLLASDGLLNSRTESLNSRIEDVGDEREGLALRLASIEERYRSQFIALDGLLSQLQTTSNFLTQQLASIPQAGQLVNKG